MAGQPTRGRRSEDQGGLGPQQLESAGVVELNLISQDTTWYGRDWARALARGDAAAVMGAIVAVTTWMADWARGSDEFSDNLMALGGDPRDPAPSRPP